MKFATFILTALAVVATAAALEVGAPVRRAEIDLEARSCTASPACTCSGPQRQFCGNESPLVGCLNGYVYECNGQTGKTCVYGIRTSCQQCGKLKC